MCTDSRRKIWLKLAGRLESLELRDDLTNIRGGVSLSGMVYVPDSAMFAKLSQDVQGNVIRYSIALHAGELRIGVLVPKNTMMLLPFNTAEFSERLQAYPAYGTASFPHVMTRSVGKDEGWYDFVWGDRYREIATRALLGDEAYQDLMADSLVHELLAIAHAFEILVSRYLTHALQDASPQVYEKRNFNLIRFWSLKSREELLREYALDAFRLAMARPPAPPSQYGEYMLIVPPEGPDREAMERLWSTIAANEFLIDPSKAIRHTDKKQ